MENLFGIKLFSIFLECNLGTKSFGTKILFYQYFFRPTLIFANTLVLTVTIFFQSKLFLTYHFLRPDNFFGLKHFLVQFFLVKFLFRTHNFFGMKFCFNQRKVLTNIFKKHFFWPTYFLGVNFFCTSMFFGHKIFFALIFLVFNLFT